MKKVHSSKNIPWLFGVGIFCLFYGAGISYVQAHLSAAALLLFLLGLACLGVCFVSLRGGGHTAVSAAALRRYAVLSVIYLVCATVIGGVNYLAYRYNRRWDLTSSRQHTLSDYTSQLIRNLQDDVEVIAFCVGLPPKYLEDLLKEYTRVSQGRVKTSIVDPLVEIGYAAQFGSVINGKEKKVVVRSLSGRKDVDFTQEPLTEEELTNAVMRVTREKRTVYFLYGHGEYDIEGADEKGLKTLTGFLDQNNIEVKRLILTGAEGIPQDCDVLVVAGPQDPLPQKEEDLIQAYLQRGGDAFFLIEHTVITTPERALPPEELHKNPSLNNILMPWGIRIAEDVVVDLASHASGDVGSPATRNYPAHDAIVRGLDYTFYIRPRSIAVLGNRRREVKVAPLVLTASPEKSWGETNRNLLVKYDDLLDRPGPVPIAFVMWEPHAEDGLSDTRIAVFTDADFLSNGFIDQYSNAEMGVNVVNWLSELDYRVFISRKDAETPRLDLTSRQKRAVGVILVAIPVFIAAVGVMGWMRQKM